MSVGRLISLALIVSALAQGTTIVCRDRPPCTRVRPNKAFFIVDAPAPLSSEGKVTLAVKEVLFGLPPETRSVEIANVVLKAGLNVVEADRSPEGSLAGSVCGFVRPDTDRLLQFLRSRAAGNESTNISIKLSAADPRRLLDGSWPLANFDVEISSATSSYLARTDAQGLAQFQSVEPGKYKVRPASAGLQMLPSSRDSVEVIERACAESSLSVAVQNSLRGVVIGPEGIAVAGVTVELRSEDFPEVRFPLNVRPERIGEFKASADAEGRFEFRHVPPGRYYLGTNLLAGFGSSPFPRIYYPCGFDQSCAEVFEVTPGFDREVRLAIPTTVLSRQVRIRVIDDEGKPVAGASISELGYRYPDRSVQDFGMLKIRSVTDAQGVVQGTGYEGVAYQVHARLQIGPIPQPLRYAGPLLVSDIVDIPAGKGPVELTLTVRNASLRR